MIVHNYNMRGCTLDYTVEPENLTRVIFGRLPRIAQAKI